MAEPHLQCLQVNLGHGRAASANVRQLAQQLGCDVCFLQEPYVREGKISGFALGSRIFHLHSGECRTGILVLNSDLDVQVVHVTANVTAVRLQWRSLQVSCLSVYAPPSGQLSEVLDQLDPLVEAHPDCIVAGDFNAKSPLWGSPRSDDRGDCLEEFLSSRNLFVLNDADSLPTFSSAVGSSWIDVTLAGGRVPGLVSSWVVLDDPTLSDHNAISFRLSLVASGPGFQKLPRYQLKGADWSALRAAFSVHDLHGLLSDLPDTDVDVFVGRLTARIGEACEEVLPHKGKRSGRSVPWWTPALSTERKRVRAIRRRFQRTSDPVQRLMYKRLYRREEARFKRSIQQAKQTSWRTYCSQVTEKTAFGVPYKLATGKVFSPVTIHSLDKGDGSRTRDLAETLDLLLATLFPDDSPDDSEHLLMRQRSLSPPETRNDEPFTEREVAQALSSLASGKAPGNDNLNLEIIRVVHIAEPHLLPALFNRCLEAGRFPSRWKEADVVLFNKPDKDPNCARSYRPICLLPVMGKLLDKLIAQRIFHHLFRVKWLSDNQFGFFPGRSTTDALLRIVDKVRLNKGRNLLTAVISLDIQGAFDTLWWPGILCCLKEAGIPRNLYLLVQDYLKERLILLSTEHVSIRKIAQRGCPQGSCSGPLLWNVVVNTALTEPMPEGVSLQAYADDLTLVITASSRRLLEERGNAALASLSGWCRKWKLRFNSSKCVVLPFGNRRNRMDRTPLFHLDGVALRSVKEMRLLGVTLDTTLSFIPHLERVKQKVSVYTHKLASLARNTWGLKGNVLLDIYHRGIERIITYACGVWWRETENLTMIRKLKSIQRIPLLRCCRTFKTAPTDALLTLCGVRPIHLTVQMEANLAWLKMGRTDSIPLSSPHLDGCSLERPVDLWSTHPVHWVGLDWSRDESISTELSIFTDGSKNGENVGSGFCAYYREQLVFSRSLRLNSEATVFQAETVGLIEALRWLNSGLWDSGESVAILLDSLSLLQSLADPKCVHPLVTRAKRVLLAAKNQRFVELLWVKAHSGVLGNETADRLAKQGSLQRTVDVSVDLSVEVLKRRLKENSLSCWQQQWQASETGRQLFQFLPTVQMVPQSLDFYVNQLLTGHGKFPAYLSRIGAVSCGQCSCGHGEGTANHYLLECRLVEGLRRELWKDILPCTGNLGLVLGNYDQLRKLGCFLYVNHSLFSLALNADDED